MDLLLDTHAFIWFMDGDNSLPEMSVNAIKNINNRNLQETESESILNDSSETASPIDLNKKAWFVLEEFISTPEQRVFIEHFEKVFVRLHSKYEEIYLIKNDHFFKIYEFENGQTVYPDFLLILSGNKQKTDFQIFIDVHQSRKHDRNASLYESLNTMLPQANILENKTILIRGISFIIDSFQPNEFEQDLEKMLETDR